MKRWQWYTVAVFAGLVALEALVYAAPTPNNCGVNMLCRVRTLIVSGDATFSGDAGWTGNVALGGSLTVNGTLRAGPVDAGNVTVNGRLCTDPACTTNYFANDGFGTLNVTGPLSASNNIGAAGTVQASGYIIASGGIENTGTSAPCTGTGSVCVNDASGLEVANAGTTTASITAAGKATVATLVITADLYTGTLDVTGGATPTVRAGAKCFCWDGTTGTALVCTLASTTLTISSGVSGDAYYALCPTTS